MIGAGKNTTVFGRIRAGARSGQPFLPTPVTTQLGSPGRIKKDEVGVYATVEEFASLAGLTPFIVEGMVTTGSLTHLRVSADGFFVHVEKGLRDLERLEHRPDSKPAQPFSSISDDAA